MRDSPLDMNRDASWVHATDSTDSGKKDDYSLSVIRLSSSSDGTDDAGASSSETTAAWQPELLRWIATLNPGRTQTEYTKAVRYFFETPGVPSYLDDLTFDLLVAYRGALALRATAHEHRPASGRGWESARRPALDGTAGAQIPSGHGAAGAEADTAGGEGRSRSRGGSQQSQSVLSPATVNLRLTALRQFLVHCSLLGSLPQLTPDRIRAALRRMSVERRRPYQVLAEHEWTDFLEAARLPALLAGQPAASPASEVLDASRDDNGTVTPRGPWGTPKALRTAPANAPQPADSDTTTPEKALPRSRAGLTGRYTAQRDYALVSLALATGLRAIELAELDVGDLVREWQGGGGEEWWLVLPDAKTKGQHGGRTLPLGPALVETLLAYVAATGRRWDRDSDQKTPLFLAGHRRRTAGQRKYDSSHDHRISPQQIRAIVDRVETQWLALREANAAPSRLTTVGETRKISPHALRHSTAIALLSGDDVSGRPPASVEHVRGWLGHFDIRTTQGYLAHLDGRRHRRPYTLSLGAPTSEAMQGDASIKDE